MYITFVGVLNHQKNSHFFRNFRKKFRILLKKKRLERDWSKNSILVVDDDYTSVVLFEEFLSPTQVLVFSASNSEEAFGILQNHPVDLILMDLQLEDISGFILLSHIRDLYPNIPVIAETAFASQDYCRKCISSGFNAFLTKPINFELLIKELDRYFEKAQTQA